MSVAWRGDIPDEMLITGVDNTDLGATQTPALTSIRTPIVEVGQAAAEQVVARLVRSRFPRQHRCGA